MSFANKTDCKLSDGY